MAVSSLDDQLTKYLTDAHAIEVQALAQMRAAPGIAGDPEIASAFSAHLAETEEHERLVRERLQARGAAPASIKDLLGGLTGKGFVLFARSQPDTPGKLVTHAFSYEHMELGAYEVLGQLADRAADRTTADMARKILQQEQAMGQRLEALFERAAEASLGEGTQEELERALTAYLADAHAIEAQAIRLLERGPELAGSPSLADAYREHLAGAQAHQELIAARLQASGAGRSVLKDAALRLGALNWGMLFQAQPDAPAKLAVFAYAFEHLEIAAYELLARVARRAADPETGAEAQRIAGEERAAAERIRSLLGEALEGSLREQSLGPR
ncbi:MAG: hypothetical protein DLM64_14425 [Solirubrobacterales bacterium]|nr:MAG: hypothetical protein DLM64_14425 [Solirubrobacterales bacterium]